MRPLWIGVTLLASVVIAFYLAGRNASRPAERATPTTPAKTPAAPPVSLPVAPPTRSSVPPAVPPSAAHETNDTRPPTPERIRQEVAANPHGTPRSLIAFAEALAPQMELAMENQEAAVKFLASMEACALGSEADTDEAARAICARNALAVGQRHSSLGRRAEELLQRLPPSVRSLAR